MTDDRPYTLIAELTYACPLACAYCSNPTDFHGHGPLLTAADWGSVFAQAAELGMLQAHLSGGEPLLRRDLESISARAAEHELYVNLITSGTPLAPARLAALKAAGVAAVQISIQDVDPERTRQLAGKDLLAEKLEAARWVRELNLALTLNFVLHRYNIERTAEFIEVAEALGAERIELANVQYLGTALLNRDALLPDVAQIDDARAVAAAARERLRGRSEVLFVLPDYHTGRPRACMSGWGRRYLVVAPDGVALPCHAARSIESLRFERVCERPLAQIWRDSPAFNAFRGEDWMREPCRSCEQRSSDFGGCRCQALALSGDPRAADPACAKSPHHDAIARLRGTARSDLLTLRGRRGSAA